MKFYLNVFKTYTQKTRQTIFINSQTLSEWDNKQGMAKKTSSSPSQLDNFGLASSIDEEGNIYKAPSNFWEARTTLSSSEFDPSKSYKVKETKDEWLLKRKLFFQFTHELIAQGNQEPGL